MASNHGHRTSYGWRLFVDEYFDITIDADRYYHTAQFPDCLIIGGLIAWHFFRDDIASTNR